MNTQTESDPKYLKKKTLLQFFNWSEILDRKGIRGWKKNKHTL